MGINTNPPVRITGNVCNPSGAQREPRAGVMYAINAGKNYLAYKHDVVGLKECEKAFEFEEDDGSNSGKITLSYSTEPEFKDGLFNNARILAEDVNFPSLLSNSAESIEEGRYLLFDLELTNENTFEVDKGEKALEVLFLDNLDGTVDGDIDDTLATNFYTELQNDPMATVKKHEASVNQIKSNFASQINTYGNRQ